MLRMLRPQIHSSPWYKVTECVLIGKHEAQVLKEYFSWKKQTAENPDSSMSPHHEDQRFNFKPVFHFSCKSCLQNLKEQWTFSCIFPCALSSWESVGKFTEISPVITKLGVKCDSKYLFLTLNLIKWNICHKIMWEANIPSSFHHSMKESLATPSRSKLLVLRLGDTHSFKIRARCQKWSPTPHT